LDLEKYSLRPYIPEHDVNQKTAKVSDVWMDLVHEGKAPRALPLMPIIRLEQEAQERRAASKAALALPKRVNPAPGDDCHQSHNAKTNEPECNARGNL
jgi:hypothetical protein